MSLFIPNRNLKLNKKELLVGRKYELSDTEALKLVEEKLGKIIKGSLPKKIKTQSPKVTNRDPVIEND